MDYGDVSISGGDQLLTLFDPPGGVAMPDFFGEKNGHSVYRVDHRSDHDPVGNGKLPQL